MTTRQHDQTGLPVVSPSTQSTVKVVKAKPATHAASVADAPTSPVTAQAKKTVTTSRSPAKPDTQPAIKRTAKASVQSTPVPPATPLPWVSKVIKTGKVAAVKPKQDMPAKPKKHKLVRDSFTIPKAEYLVLGELKLRAAELASPVKKTEVIRAGIKALAGMSDTAFLAAVKAVPVIKTGRPALK